MVTPMTMKEVDVYCGIMRENVCRHISVLQDAGRVTFIRKRKCSITGYRNVKEYTADPALFPKFPRQLNLFDSENFDVLSHNKRNQSF